MIRIIDVFKRGRRIVFRSKWGNHIVKSKFEVAFAFPHLDLEDIVFLKDTTSNQLRVLFNGRYAMLQKEDFE